MKKIILLIILLIVIILISIFTIKQPRRISNQNVSGIIAESQIWSGEIIITGDVTTLPYTTLIITHGTKVKFLVQDDQNSGHEVPADGYNDLDPTRLESYDKTHSGIITLGKLIVNGTPENPVIFTSASENPKHADWVAIMPQMDGSIIQYSIIKWARNGISPGENQPNTIIRNNNLTHGFWGPISLGWSSAQAYNNVIRDCGHEGIDVQGGNPIIENNTIYDCHVGIVILRGSAVVRNNRMINCSGGKEGNGFHIGGEASPILENNYFEPFPENLNKEWRYGDFTYLMWGDPIGTPVLTEVYKEKELARYASPGYKIEGQNYEIELPIEADEWIVYGFKSNEWYEIEENITDNKIKLPEGYSLYIFIPDPTEEEKVLSIFKVKHNDIPIIMAV